LIISINLRQKLHFFIILQMTTPTKPIILPVAAATKCHWLVINDHHLNPGSEQLNQTQIKLSNKDPVTVWKKATLVINWILLYSGWVRAEWVRY